MAPMSDSRSEAAEARKEGVGHASAFELQLAAMVVKAAVEHNGGRDRAARFWDDDLLESIDSKEGHVDPEPWDPDEETVPEMAEINRNIYECD